MGTLTFCYDNAERAEAARDRIERIMKQYGIGLYPVQIAYLKDGEVIRPYDTLFLNRSGAEAALLENEKANKAGGRADGARL